ncbi:MAG: TetR/AcrR family transcriptional regulator [Candidatus Saccharibacteria bacterium]
MSDTKELILDAAQRMIARQGVTNASVNAIVEEAGISKGALYHHYKSKDMLLCDVVDRAIKDYSEPVLALRKGDQDHFKEGLDRGIAEHLQNEVHNKLLFYLTHEAILGNEELKSRLAEMYSGRVDTLRGLLNDMYGLSETRHTRTLAATFLGAVEGQIMQLMLGSEAVRADEFAEIWHFMIYEGAPLLLKRLKEIEDAKAREA